jgi:hypothetical protein
MITQKRATELNIETTQRTVDRYERIKKERRLKAKEQRAYKDALATLEIFKNDLKMLEVCGE